MTDNQYKNAVAAKFKQFMVKKGTIFGIEFETFKEFYPSVRPWTSFNSTTSDVSWQRMFDVYDSDRDGLIIWNEAWIRLMRQK